MGLTRKVMSVGTGGLVSWHDAQGRAAKYSKQTRNAARAQVAQNAMQLELQRQQLAALDHANVREEARDITAAQGWFPDPSGQANTLRWFDGMAWTEYTMPCQAPPPPSAR